ncbi:MAG: hypothetical protein MRY32_02055 [Rickettsiales bacterium]|nr:hypothetical protein [Rickettsiales bacterium]
MQTHFAFKNPLSEKIWNAINCIPEDVLEEYLADNIIDEQEIDDITKRLGEVCEKHNMGFTVDQASHDLIRQLVHQAVHAIRKKREQPQSQTPKQAEATIENQLCNVTLNDVRNMMGELLQKGQIASEAQHLSRADKISHGDSIPGDDDDDNLYTD